MPESGWGEPVLAIRDLAVQLPEGADRRLAVDGASLELHRGETVCVVGESGSGKSVTAAAIMGLLPKGPAHGRARLDPPRGRGPDPGHERPAPRAAWGADGHGLPGADDRAQPDDELRAADRRGPARAHPAGRGGAPAKSAGRHGRSPAARARSTLPRLPAPDLRRPAPAGHDRHGARAGARAADSRRADDRSRRDHAGADPASDPRAAAAARDRGPVHHP